MFLRENLKHKSGFHLEIVEELEEISLVNHDFNHG
jgi:hypothetical protein